MGWIVRYMLIQLNLSILYSSSVIDIDNDRAGVPITAEPLPVAILVPNEDSDGGCTKRLLEHGISEINNRNMLYASKITSYYNTTSNKTILTSNTTTLYFIKPYYGEISNDFFDTMKTLYDLISAPPLKSVCIGTPFPSEGEAVFDYLLLYLILQFSYSVADIPIKTSMDHHVQVPSFMNSSFDAAIQLFEDLRWKRYSVVYDLDSPPHQSNNLILEDKINNLSGAKDTKLIVKSIIYTVDQPTKENLKTVDELAREKARIVFGLFSIAGARQMFCGAYRKKMYKHRTTWLLFEKLPVGWASSKYDSLKVEGGHRMAREIPCTEDEILLAADGHLLFTNTVFRKDIDTILVNGKTLKGFKKEFDEIQRASGNKCRDSATEAYDALWTFAKTYESFGKKKDFLDYGWTGKKFNRQFAIDGTREALSVAFEGVTGPVSFKINPRDHDRDPVERANGLIDISVFRKDVGYQYVTIYNPIQNGIEYQNDTLFQIFGSTVPRDRSKTKIVGLTFSHVCFIIFWVLAFLGIVLTSCSFFTSLSVSVKTKGFFLNFECMFDVSFLLGCLLCYTSIIIYGIDLRFVTEKSIGNICYVFITLLMTGYSLTFGSLFTKIWLLYKRKVAPHCKANKVLNVSQVIFINKDNFY